jgi:hypothetical protein
MKSSPYVLLLKTPYKSYTCLGLSYLVLLSNSPKRYSKYICLSQSSYNAIPTMPSITK